MRVEPDTEFVVNAEARCGAGSILAMKRSYLPLFSQLDVKAMNRPSLEIVGFGIAQ
jgi:hypothetical protein